MIVFKVTNKILFYTLIFGLFVFGSSCDKDNPVNAKPVPVVTGPSQLHTEGRWFLNENNEKVILRGVNIASLEWTSTGDNVLQSVEYAATNWHVNLVRIPTSQDRWFGKAPEQKDGGNGYRSIIDQVVNKCSELDIYVLLELHWSNANEWGQHIGQHKMPDNNSQIYLEALAQKYGDHSAVLLGLYNEPYDISWDIWLNGGQITHNWDRDGDVTYLEYDTPGVQALYNAVRAAGASKNLIVIGALDWGYDLRGILTGYAVQGENIVYDTHCYPWKSTNWDQMFGDVGEIFPLLVGEWGGEQKDQNYGIKLASYLRSHKFCWTAWDFHTSAGPTLIKNWAYEPTWFGSLVLKELTNPIIIE